VIAPTLLTLLLSGFDAGGMVGGAFPATGLAPSHASSARFGLVLGWSQGPSRIELDCSYAGLPGPQFSPYRLDLIEAALTYAFEYVHRPNWGAYVAGGPGYGLVRRNLLTASEDGQAPAAHIGAGLAQRQGRTRASFGIDNAVFPSAAQAGSTRRTSVTWLLTINAVVTYAF
jgi:hypothetical protein